MNNSELESILKRARLPERPEEFWEMFPRQVASRLGRTHEQESHAEQRPFLRWAWGLAAVVCGP